MFNTILVPLDGSEHAIKALRVAASLARGGAATLHLMTVCGLAESMAQRRNVGLQTTMWDYLR